MASSFKPFPKERGYLKLLVYGEPGTQKTRRALRMPEPIYMIDMENGSTDYGDLVRDKEAYILNTKSHVEVVKAVNEISNFPAGKCATLIIDPMTQVWQSLQQGYIEKMCKKKRCTPEDVFLDVGAWSKLKRAYGDLMATLMSAQCHVIMICRGKERINERGQSLGYGYEGEKSTVFLANVVIESQPKGDKIIKDRTGTFTESEVQPLIEYTRFLDQTGTDIHALQSDSEAAELDALEHHDSWVSDRLNFIKRIKELDLTYDKVAKFCSSMDRPEPSNMTTEKRNALIKYLQENQI